MEYLSILVIALSSCSGFVLGLVCAYWFYRSTLNQTKSDLGDKTLIASLLRTELSKNGKSKNGKSKKKYYNRKNNRSKSSGKKL